MEGGLFGQFNRGIREKYFHSKLDKLNGQVHSFVSGVSDINVDLLSSEAPERIKDALASIHESFISLTSSLRDLEMELKQENFSDDQNEDSLSSRIQKLWDDIRLSISNIKAKLIKIQINLLRNNLKDLESYVNSLTEYTENIPSGTPSGRLPMPNGDISSSISESLKRIQDLNNLFDSMFVTAENPPAPEKHTLLESPDDPLMLYEFLKGLKEGGFSEQQIIDLAKNVLRIFQKEILSKSDVSEYNRIQRILDTLDFDNKLREQVLLFFAYILLQLKIKYPDNYKKIVDRLKTERKSQLMNRALDTLRSFVQSSRLLRLVPVPLDVVDEAFKRFFGSAFQPQILKINQTEIDTELASGLNRSRAIKLGVDLLQKTANRIKNPTIRNRLNSFLKKQHNSNDENLIISFLRSLMLQAGYTSIYQIGSSKSFIQKFSNYQLESFVSGIFNEDSIADDIGSESKGEGEGENDARSDEYTSTDDTTGTRVEGVVGKDIKDGGIIGSNETGRFVADTFSLNSVKQELKKSLREDSYNDLVEQAFDVFYTYIETIINEVGIVKGLDNRSINELMKEKKEFLLIFLLNILYLLDNVDGKEGISINEFLTGLIASNSYDIQNIIRELETRLLDYFEESTERRNNNINILRNNIEIILRSIQEFIISKETSSDNTSELTAESKDSANPVVAYSDQIETRSTLRLEKLIDQFISKNIQDTVTKGKILLRNFLSFPGINQNLIQRLKIFLDSIEINKNNIPYSRTIEGFVVFFLRGLLVASLRSQENKWSEKYLQELTNNIADLNQLMKAFGIDLNTFERELDKMLQNFESQRIQEFLQYLKK